MKNTIIGLSAIAIALAAFYYSYTYVPLNYFDLHEVRGKVVSYQELPIGMRKVIQIKLSTYTNNFNIAGLSYGIFDRDNFESNVSIGTPVVLKISKEHADKFRKSQYGSVDNSDISGIYSLRAETFNFIAFKDARVAHAKTAKIYAPVICCMTLLLGAFYLSSKQPRRIQMDHITALEKKASLTFAAGHTKHSRKVT